MIKKLDEGRDIWDYADQAKFDIKGALEALEVVFDNMYGAADLVGDVRIDYESGLRVVAACTNGDGEIDGTEDDLAERVRFWLEIDDESGALDPREGMEGQKRRDAWASAAASLRKVADEIDAAVARNKARADG